MAKAGTSHSRRLSIEDVIQELQNDSDSGESDLYSSESETDERYEVGEVECESDNGNSASDHDISDENLSDISVSNDNDSDFEPDNGQNTRSVSSDSDFEPPASNQRPERGRGRQRGRGQPRGRGRGRGTSSRGRGRGTSRGRGRGTPLVSCWRNAGPQRPNDIPFTGQPGIVDIDVTDFKPIDYLELYFNEDLINHLCIQTNLYANQYITGTPNLKRFSRVHDWVNVTNVEMKRFLAIVLLMGLVKLPTIELYWSKKILYNLPVFNSLMKRNRFQVILKFLHFNDNSSMPERNDPNYDRLYKIKPVLDHLFERFQAVYTPRREVCVDKSLLLWKGRLLFRQYIPLKRARFGIKVYLCCESDGDQSGSGGYCFRFKVYAGKDDPVSEIRPVIPDDASHLSISEQMVVFLIAPLLGEGYHVYTDNWYTSLRLLLYLKEKQTLACGTIRANRGIPNELTEKDVNRQGDSHALIGDNKIVATKYHSTKVVYLMSTVHGHNERNVRSRRRTGTIKRPQVSIEYNANMGGVDKQDQLLQPYECTRKTMKWSKKLFFHFLQVSTCNAFILCAKYGYQKPFQKYLEEVIIAWSEADADAVQVDDDTVRLKDKHFPDFIPPTPSKQFPSRRCKVCYKKGIPRKEVRIYCPDCPSKPALCIPGCFRNYHSKVAYWM